MEKRVLDDSSVNAGKIRRVPPAGTPPLWIPAFAGMTEMERGNDGGFAMAPLKEGDIVLFALADGFGMP